MRAQGSACPPFEVRGGHGAKARLCPPYGEEPVHAAGGTEIFTDGRSSIV
jgi:hypothetical protein